MVMGYEPCAARRLRRVVASTLDRSVRDTLEPLLMDLPNTSLDVAARPVRAPRTPPAPDRRVEGLGDVAPAGRAVQGDLPLGEARLGGDLPGLTSELSGADLAELLMVLAQQATTLRLVWEAHARGAITLPESLEQRVEQVRNRVPRFLAPRRR
jgi:hypothetical protein